MKITRRELNVLIESYIYTEGAVGKVSFSGENFQPEECGFDINDPRNEEFL